MKTLLILSVVFIISCGSSEEEIRLREKAVRDSFALAEANKKLSANNIESPPASENKPSEVVTMEETATVELRQQLKKEEIATPLKYLYINSDTWKLNLIGEMVVEGWVCNKAALAGFKDIDLKITYYSKTGREIATKWIQINEFLQHGRCILFKRKIGGDKTVKNISITVHSAIGY